MSTKHPSDLKCNAEAIAALELLEAEERVLLDRRITMPLDDAARTRLRALQWRIAAQRERIYQRHRSNYPHDDIIIMRY